MYPFFAQAKQLFLESNSGTLSDNIATPHLKSKRTENTKHSELLKLVLNHENNIWVMTSENLHSDMYA